MPVGKNLSPPLLRCTVTATAAYQGGSNRRPTVTPVSTRATSRALPTATPYRAPSEYEPAATGAFVSRPNDGVGAPLHRIDVEASRLEVEDLHIASVRPDLEVRLCRVVEAAPA